MIIYQATKSQFLHHALRDDIEDAVSRHYCSATGQGVGPSEIQSWNTRCWRWPRSVQVGFDPTSNTFFIDRRTASPEFLGQSERHDADRLLDAPVFSLDVWVDGSTLEVCADGGTVVLSDLIYANPLSAGVRLFHGAENPQVQSLDLHRVRATMYTPVP